MTNYLGAQYHVKYSPVTGPICYFIVPLTVVSKNRDRKLETKQQTSEIYFQFLSYLYFHASEYKVLHWGYLLMVLGH